MFGYYVFTNPGEAVETESIHNLYSLHVPCVWGAAAKEFPAQTFVL